MQPVKRVIAADLQQRIRDMKRTPLQASVTLKPGHDYWWFQEFGTGPRGSEAPAYGLGPDDFTRPASVAKHKRGGMQYKISPDKHDKLFFYWARFQDWFFVPGGGIAKGASGQRKGHSWFPIRKTEVTHPGVRPQAMLRLALWGFRRDARLALMAMARRKQWPLREEIAQALNRHLRQLNASLEAVMPRYEQPTLPAGFTRSKDSHDLHKGGPLAKAWDVVYFDDKTTGTAYSVKG